MESQKLTAAVGMATQSILLKPGLPEEETDGASRPPFFEVQSNHLKRLVGTGADATKRMYQSTYRRVVRAIRLAQRYSRRYEFKGNCPAIPSEWEIVEKYGPTVVWGYYRERKKHGCLF